MNSSNIIIEIIVLFIILSIIKIIYNKLPEEKKDKYNMINNKTNRFLDKIAFLVFIAGTIIALIISICIYLSLKEFIIFPIIIAVWNLIAYSLINKDDASVCLWLWLWLRISIFVIFIQMILCVASALSKVA